jgi:transcriptional regulator with XRE-family HTH domain
MHKLKEIRFFNRITQPLLALKTGIQQSRISLIENSLVMPRDEEKKKIAKALGIKMQDIFTEEADDKNGR